MRAREALKQNTQAAAAARRGGVKHIEAGNQNGEQQTAAASSSSSSGPPSGAVGKIMEAKHQNTGYDKKSTNKAKKKEHFMNIANAES